MRVRLIEMQRLLALFFLCSWVSVTAGSLWTTPTHGSLIKLPSRGGNGFLRVSFFLYLASQAFLYGGFQKKEGSFWCSPTAEALGSSSWTSSSSRRQGGPRSFRPHTTRHDAWKKTTEGESSLRGFDSQGDQATSLAPPTVSDLIYMSPPPDPLDFAFLPSASLSFFQLPKKTSSLSSHHTRLLSQTVLPLSAHPVDPHPHDHLAASSHPADISSFSPTPNVAVKGTGYSQTPSSRASRISFLSTQVHASSTASNSTVPTVPASMPQTTLPSVVVSPAIKLPSSPAAALPSPVVLPPTAVAPPALPVVSPLAAIAPSFPGLPPQPQQALVSAAPGGAAPPQANLSALKTVEEEATREILQKASELGAKNVTITLTPDAAILATSQIGQPLTPQQILAIQTAAEQNVARELEALATLRHQTSASPMTTSSTTERRRLLLLSAWTAPVLVWWSSLT